MKCNQCPYNNHGGGSNGKIDRPVIMHPQGNYLQLTIPISVKWTIVVDGKEETIEQGTITPDMQVYVELSKGKKVYRYEPLLTNNQVSIIDKGKLPIGTYDITIIIIDGDNTFRYKKYTMLQVFDSVTQGVSYENDEFNVLAIYPVVEGRTTAISVGPDDVTISEAGKFQGDDTPEDNYADITAIYGDSSIEVGEDDVTIII